MGTSVTEVPWPEQFVLLDCYSYNLNATQDTIDSCRLGQAH
jgi:hypothetical protein